MGYLNVNRSLLKKSFRSRRSRCWPGVSLFTSLPAAHAAPLDKTFVTKEGLQAVTRLLQAAGPEAGINAVPGEAYISEDINTSSARKSTSSSN